MRKSLCLSGDLDDVDLVKDVERAFGIQLSNEDLARCWTVGELFALVVSALPSDWQGGDRCAEAMCFYRLKRVVLTLAPHLDLRPSTPITMLRGVSVRQLYRGIQSVGGLRPPVPYLSLWGGISLLLAVAAPAGPLLLGVPWWAAITWMVAAAICYRLAPIRLPPDLSTFGDLVRHVTARSIGMLAAEGARLRPAEAWKALIAICEDHSLEKYSEIGADTLFFRGQPAAS